MAVSDFILTVDGGGSKTRAALIGRDGTALGERSGGPCNLFQDRRAGLAEIRRLWNQLANAAGLDPDADAARTALSAGLAGASAPHSPAHFRRAFADFAACHLSTDGFTMLLSATDGAPGRLLAIGTGVVGYRLYHGGRVQTFAGWGFPVHDRGGGAWLGWRAIGAWLEYRDGYDDQPPSTLWPRLEAELGQTTGSILGWLEPARPADFATLAPIVIDAARAGDAKGISLLAEAAGNHARLARTMTPTAREPLVLAGGLAPVLRPYLERALGEALADADRIASPFDGARLIAQGTRPAEFNAPRESSSPCP